MELTTEQLKARIAELEQQNAELSNDRTILDWWESNRKKFDFCTTPSEFVALLKNNASGACFAGITFRDVITEAMEQEAKGQEHE